MLNKSLNEFQPRTTQCRNKNGEMLGSVEWILKRWLQQFDENGFIEFGL